METVSGRDLTAFFQQWIYGEYFPIYSYAWGPGPGAGEITVFCGAMVGASMGFLWWNCYPAQIFMGDTGSLPLGGVLAVAALLTRQRLQAGGGARRPRRSGLQAAV